MANSTITYTGNGSTTQFALNFTLGILNRAHVTCRVNNEVDGSGDPVYRQLSWITDSLVNVLGAVPANGVPVRFDRTVPKNVLYHDYVNGAPITDDNLNQSNMQSLMAVHEVLDGRLPEGYADDLDINNHKIVNLAPATNGQDAVNLTQLQNYTGNAPTFAAQAAASAASAAASAAIAANADSVAGALYGTSATSTVVATGSKTFTTQAGKAFAVGVWLLVASAANPANFMHGQVTAYSGTSLTVNVSNKGGTGTFTDWVISVSGVRGITGSISGISDQPLVAPALDDKIPAADTSDANTTIHFTPQQLLTLLNTVSTVTPTVSDKLVAIDQSNSNALALVGVQSVLDLVSSGLQKVTTKVFSNDAAWEIALEAGYIYEIEWKNVILSDVGLLAAIASFDNGVSYATTSDLYLTNIRFQQQISGGTFVKPGSPAVHLTAYSGGSGGFHDPMTTTPTRGYRGKLEISGHESTTDFKNMFITYTHGVAGSSERATGFGVGCIKSASAVTHLRFYGTSSDVYTPGMTIASGTATVYRRPI